MVVASSSLADSLEPDAGHFVRLWAREMQTTEAEIVTRLVRQAVMVQRARRGFKAITEVRDVLGVKVRIPFGKQREVVLAVINSRPGPWTVPQIREHLRNTTDYYINPNGLTMLLTKLRRSKAIVEVKWGVVSRVEP